MKETKSFSAKVVTPRVNAGFTEVKPSNAGEIIDAPFECVRVVQKKDKNGDEQVYVILQINAKDNVVSKAYNASDLLGKETHPCVKKGDKWEVDDDNYVCTWESDLEFNKKA